ncbi:MAG TPA: hypothetical protein DC059_03395, partial [Dietzia sp.]|nr:hypothetical protein [Dietzia sp.]
MAGPGEITDVVDVLDALVDHGRLVGYVCGVRESGRSRIVSGGARTVGGPALGELSLIHISEPTRQEAISYAVFCLKK